MNGKILYFVWYKHARRAETLARELGAQLVFVYERRVLHPWLKPLRYLIQAWQTWQLLERERPAFVIAQSPPAFAPLAVALWCKVRGKRRVSYLIDCHPGTFYHKHWRWALPLIRPLALGAAISLLCNEDAQNTMAKWGANYIFLPDGLPDLSLTSGTIGREGDARIAVISTYADDEPVIEVLQAARLLPHVTFYITGDLQRVTKELLDLKPENVVMTGYLRGGEYNALLHNVQGILVVSRLKTTLSCGAFEALSLAKPTIVSDLPEQRRWFSRGFLLAENTPEDFARAVKELFQDYAECEQKAEALRAEYFAAREPKLAKLRSLLQKGVEE